MGRGPRRGGAAVRPLIERSDSGRTAVLRAVLGRPPGIGRAHSDQRQSAERTRHTACTTGPCRRRVVSSIEHGSGPLAGSVPRARPVPGSARSSSVSTIPSGTRDLTAAMVMAVTIEPRWSGCPDGGRAPGEHVWLGGTHSGDPSTNPTTSTTRSVAASVYRQTRPSSSSFETARFAIAGVSPR